LFRQWLSERVNLIGAVRLPNSAFKQNAGTEVTTDLIFFQRTDTPGAADWIGLKPSPVLDDSGKPFPMSEYFYRNRPG
jgi:hypothetical protein